MSLAGSPGYVAPEVLGKQGHGKAVDVWCTGCVLRLASRSAPSCGSPTCAHSIITYVLLCGYSPFRAEDTQTLIRETMEAKIEFHTKYWKNVSEAGAFLFFFTLLLDLPRRHVALRCVLTRPPRSEVLHQAAAEPQPRRAADGGGGAE
jgi:calcium/calmodulin-dependent protein kinase I